MTVPSCEQHNNSKSDDDMYILAHICLNASPINRSREIFMQRITPQLDFNDAAFRKTLAKDAIRLADGTVKYPVDLARFDGFFDALSCGIIYKSCGQQLPKEYKTQHIYHNFVQDGEPIEQALFKEKVRELYSGDPMDVLNFGQVKAMNAPVYAVKIFGVPDFGSSLTIIHEFYGVFNVTSMLTKLIELPT